MRKKDKRISCVSSSDLFNKINNSKYNGKLLSNGDIRIGDDLAMCEKTHRVYKLK